MYKSSGYNKLAVAAVKLIEQRQIITLMYKCNNKCLDVANCEKTGPSPQAS